MAGASGDSNVQQSLESNGLATDNLLEMLGVHCISPFDEILFFLTT